MSHWASQLFGNTPSRYYWWDEDNDAPQGGDRAFYGYTGMLSEYNAYGDLTDVPVFLTVPSTEWGDYSGATYTRSNNEALRDDHPDTFVEVSGDYSSSVLMLPANAYIPTYLAAILTALADEYPVYDESHMSNLEMEIITDSWDNYGCWDFKREVTRAIETLDDSIYDADDMMPSDSALTDLFQDAICDGSATAEMDDATSAYFRTEALAEWLARFILGTRKVTHTPSE